MDIDIAWTESGTAAARRHGIGYDEAVAIIDGARSAQLIFDDSVWFVGEAAIGLVTVIADRQARGTSIYEITNVRPAGGHEARFWEAKNR